MGITAKSGPNLIYGITTTTSGATTQYNEERGPSIFDLGEAILDPRPPFNYYPGAPVGTKVYGLWGQLGVVDAVASIQNASLAYIPGTIVSCLTGSTAVASGSAITLNTSTITGITYSPNITAPETNTTVTPALAIDYVTSSNPGITFGSGATITMWNPANAIARCIVVRGTTTSSADDSGASISVSGRDIYGFKMTETITLSSLSQTQYGWGRKAFKYITGINWVNSSLLNSTNINIGFADKFGFPTRVDTPIYIGPLLTVSSGSSVALTYQSSQLTSLSQSSVGTTYAMSTGTTPTSTTADVRGVWVSTTNWVANQRLQMYCTLSVNNLATISAGNAAGIFGSTQFSSV